MNTSNQHHENREREMQDFNTQQPYNTRPDDRKDDIEQEEEDIDEAEADERRDWGDVDPAGGEAPTSPGSAV